MANLNYLISNFSNDNLTNYLFSKINNFKTVREPFSDFIVNHGINDNFGNPIKIGQVALENSDELLIFTCEVKKELSQRSSKKQQFEIAKKVLKEDFKDGAIFVFYDGSGNFRFSFIRKYYGEDKKYSNWKRFTYFVQSNKQNKTFKRQLGACNFTSLDVIEQAFSVSELTKEFYTELFQWYEWTLSDEIGVTFPKNTAISEDNREKLEEQIIRLITRLLFVWFIKQKDLVPNYLFKVDKLKDILKDFNPNDSVNGDYYNAILQNLFFATLNKEIDERAFAEEEGKRDIKTLYRYPEMFNISKDDVIDFFKPIPFLNGGLFECLDKDLGMDGVKYHLDGFSRNDAKVKGQYSHRAFIPNIVFFDEEKGIIPLLERYNFTVEENAPEDIQVALDPELLGNVFENLLGAFNHETKESARKQSGSFYTPREIVDFMVNESLQSYLETKLGEIDINSTLTDEQKRKIYNALLEVKILDPACGSGAFPMGILNGIISLLEKIGAAEELDMYKLKLHLIENCVYGIDIQNIAVQISKLRFFISLIVEQQEKDLEAANYGITTLPNLETKFVAANTLIGLQKREQQGNLFEDPAIETTKQKITAIRHEHFSANSAKSKKDLRDRDTKLRNKLINLLEENHDFAPEDAKQVALWNPYDQNSSSPFFDSDWMFGIKEGFDIVIGNPPYIQLQKDGGRLAKEFEKEGYKTFARTGDIYSLFYEKGVNLLKTKGSLCYITSNKWMRAGYGEKTRKFFAENTNPKLLIDFAGQKIFESATVDTNILLVSKEKNEQKTLACIVKEKIADNLSVFVRQEGTMSSFISSESWVILSEIEQRIKEKIEKVGTPLKDWDIQINYGIKTGFNEAFIIDGAKRKELIAEDPKSDEIIRPILRGRDIKRYGYEFADLWLINTHNGIKEKGIKPVDTNDYPAIKRHLDKYWDQIEKRQDQGDTPYNLRNCAYMEDFYRQKIIYPETTQGAYFAFDLGDMLIDKTCFMLISDNAKYLQATLSSKLFEFAYKTIFSSIELGTNGYQYNKHALLKLPIFFPERETEQQFETLLEEQRYDAIDELVYEMYNLTDEERKTIGFVETD